jgi:DNA repair exonuclease SbcCD nuclease subunit
MTAPLTLAHISDTHIGFTQYPKKAPSGRGQREQDFVRAFLQAVASITAEDPPLVIHAGDFYDRPVVSLRHQKQGQEALAALSLRPDGTQRAVVVISGNHDQPSDPREPCALELDTPIPGVHIVTSKYALIDFDPIVAAGQAPEELTNVVIHCLPHDVLRTVDFDDVLPVDGKINILVSHGVVGGSELYKRTIGREYAIPIDVLTRGWDYVAMGHWHKRGPVAVGGYSPTTSPIWYSGSVENNGFSDITDGSGSGRGYLLTTINPGQAPTVKGVDLPVRAMFKLPTIEAADLRPEEISALLTQATQEADTDGAVVMQVVTGMTRDVWNLVNLDPARGAARAAVWFEIRPVFADEVVVTAEGEEPADSLNALLERVAESILTQGDDTDTILSKCRALLAVELDTPSSLPEEDK